MHQHGVINAAVVLKGELTVITEKNDTIHLKPNEALSEVVNLWHYGVNNGNTPVELIIFYAGAEGIKNTTIK
jgi:quercetin dioxygenase-like cupin family protein